MCVNIYGTIKDIKAKLSGIEGVAPDMQEIVYDGKVLSNEKKLVEYKIHDSCLIRMFPRDGSVMTIHIKSLRHGILIPLEVNSQDTISTVKTKFQAKEELPSKHMYLMHNGNLLEDANTLSSYDIQAESILYAICCGGCSIHLYVSTAGLIWYELNVKPWCYVESLKAAIESVRGIPVNQQRLMFCGRSIDDCKTFSHYNIQAGSTIEMVLVLTFFVQLLNGLKIKMEMQCSDTVGDVKNKLREMLFIEPGRQVLVHNGWQMDDCQTLNYYRLQNEPTLQLFRRYSDIMQIFVRIEAGRTITMYVLKTDSVDSLKDKIKAKEGIPKNNQKIIFEGKRLESERSIADYGIRHESTLILGVCASHMCSEMELYIEIPDGRVVAVEIDKMASVKDLQDYIQFVGTLREWQRLVFDGRLLESERTLKYYKITSGSVISVHIEPSF